MGGPQTGLGIRDIVAVGIGLAFLLGTHQDARYSLAEPQLQTNIKHHLFIPNSHIAQAKPGLSLPLVMPEIYHEQFEQKMGTPTRHYHHYVDESIIKSGRPMSSALISQPFSLTLARPS